MSESRDTGASSSTDAKAEEHRRRNREYMRRRRQQDPEYAAREREANRRRYNERVKDKRTRSSRTWTDAEERQAVEMRREGKPAHEIADALDRTTGAVHERLRQLGLSESESRRRRARWTPEQEEDLIRRVLAGQDSPTIARETRRPQRSVEHRRRVLREAGRLPSPYRRTARDGLPEGYAEEPSSYIDERVRALGLRYGYRDR